MLLNGLPWKWTEIILSFWDYIQVLHFGLFHWLWGLLQFFSGILDHSSRCNGHEWNSPIPVHFSSLLPKMLIFTNRRYCHLLFDHFQFTLLHGPNIPVSYAILFFIASDFTSITSHIHNWALFLLWLHPFILSGVISPLISSSTLGTYQPGEFIFQCPNFLPFHTVHRILKVRIMKLFAIPFSSGLRLPELSTMTRLSWVALYGMAHSFIELDKAVVHVIRLASFLWLWFSVCLPSDE